VGHHDNRLNLAKEFGATNIINSLKVDPYWEVRKLVDGHNYNRNQTPWYSGVDIAFDFAGKMASLQLCASLCKPKKRAKLMMPAAYGTEKFSIGEYLMNRAPSLIPCHPAHSLDIIDDLNRALIALEEGIFPIKQLVTHKFSLDEIELALDTAMNEKDTYIKGIILPNQ
jgi:threonine dehydrogenase-like Zn-dependent dehydrogenase